MNEENLKVGPFEKLNTLSDNSGRLNSLKNMFKKGLKSSYFDYSESKVT